ncbi:MAG: PAS domain S-box protein [Candidatus Obscuribacterales bacterium]|nr:PAS domain S-box protein [Candidatus Obscuribacterales bacterium]
MRIKVFHRGLILVGVPLLIELVLIGSLGLLLIQSDREFTRESQSRKFTASLAKLMALTYETPYYLIASIQLHNDALFAAYKKNIQQVRALQKDLTANTPVDNRADDKKNYELSQDLISNENILMNSLESFAEATERGSAGKVFIELPKIEVQFHSLKSTLTEKLEQASEIGTRFILESEKRLNGLRQIQIVILICGIVTNLATGIFLIIYYRRNITERLKRIADNTKLLGENKALLAPLSGSDEIKQLDQAFHSMSLELAESAERERDLFNNASDVICVLDDQLRFSKINPASFRLWNYQPADLIGKKFSEIIEPEDISNSLAAIERAKTTKTPLQFENRLRTNHGKILEVLWSSYWSESENSLFCIVHDISERKNIERLKRQFLTMVTFDLKKPLSAISASLDNLVNNKLQAISDIAKDKIAVAGRNVQRLLSLVNDLLHFTQLDSGTLEINRTQCSINDLLSRSAQDVEAVAQKQNVSLVIESPSINGLVDPDRLMQVLVNLLSNAIKFSPAGGTVKLIAALAEGTATIKIIDQGRGVPKTHQKAIFEKYKQVDAADGKRKAGTGLGLPICKQIIEEHGGSIGVESSEGAGSTFWFTIPIDGREIVPVHETETVSTVIKEPVHKVKPATKSGSRLNLMQKGAILIGIPILFELLFVGSLSVLLVQSNQERINEVHERNIAFRSSQMLGKLLIIGLIMNGEPTEKAWHKFQRELKKLNECRADLKNLVANDPQEKAHLDKVESYYVRIDKFAADANTHMEGKFRRQHLLNAWSSRHQLIPTTVGLVHRLQRLVDEAQRKEFVSPIKQQALREKQSQLLLAGLAINLLISIALAIFFSKDITSRLKILADNADKLGKDKDLNAELGGSDEIAKLDKAFHRTAAAITEARHKDRAVFDNSQDFICVLNNKGQFVSLNPACERLLQYNADELLLKSLLDLVHPEDAEETRKILFSNYSEIKLENRLIRKDGSPAHILWSFSQTKDHDNFFCIAHDISSRKELEQLKQEFLAMVSHDLRTPLTSISGIAKLMTVGAFGPQTAPTIAILEEITANVDRLIELINDLLDMEKLEAGQMQLVLEQISLNELLTKATEANHKITLEPLPSTINIQADKDRLLQACANMLNYFLADSAGEGMIRISTETNSKWVEIKFEAASAVLSTKAKDTLFERFKETSGINSSDGLALPIARKIIESHGGAVGAESFNQTGTRLWIRLPLESATPA